MTDIVSVGASGMEVYNTQTQRAANILQVQLGSLEYAQDLGIDLKYFLTENIKFQDDSFKAYIVQVLASNGINVESLVEVMSSLSTDYNINLSPEETSSGLIVR